MVATVTSTSGKRNNRRQSYNKANHTEAVYILKLSYILRMLGIL